MMIEVEKLNETMSIINLNGKPIFCVYYDPKDGYTDLTVYDSDNLNSVEVITENKFKTYRETEINPRRVKKC